MRQHLQNFWWLAGIPLLVIALCFAPVREFVRFDAADYNLSHGFWAYGLLYLIGLLSIAVWAPFKVHRGHHIRAIFIVIYGFLLIVLSVGRADFGPRTEELSLFRMYVGEDMSYEEHVTNLLLRRGDWLTFEEECVKPLRVDAAHHVLAASANNSSYCKSLGQIEMGYGIRARTLLEDQYTTMRAVANTITMDTFDYQQCLASKRCIVVGNDRIAIAVVDRELNTADLWCYKGDSCIILPILIRNENEANLLPIPAANEVDYNARDVYKDFEMQPFFTPRTCQFNPLCSLMQLVGAPIK